jgi:hypothetical protein
VVLENDFTQKGFIAWIANKQDGSTEQWSLRVLIATSLPGLPVPVTNLECQLVTEKGWTQPIMPSNRSLTGWAPKTYGFPTNGEFEYY